MQSKASDIAAQLARDAEAVCRHFLPAGRRSGSYWIVGNVAGSPGRSMFVRLRDRGGRSAGRWTDAATGEHGDLLDVIRETQGLRGFRETLDEARRFLSLPLPPTHHDSDRPAAPTGSPEASRRLFEASHALGGTLVERYLSKRGIDDLVGLNALRFHPRCWHRLDDGRSLAWPAMIAAVTDLAGNVHGVHRTWLARDPESEPSNLGKAPFMVPRRAMGNLYRHAVRFGHPQSVLLAGEGIETVLSLRCLMPELPMAASLSAGNLAAIVLPEGLRRLYVAGENDAESTVAIGKLTERGRAAGVDVIGLTPRLNDFNDDLRLLGPGTLRECLLAQMEPVDAARFIRAGDIGVRAPAVGIAPQRAGRTGGL